MSDSRSARGNRAALRAITLFGTTLTLTLGLSLTAWADTGSGTTYAGTGDSWQQLSWNDGTRRLYIRVHTDPAMSTDRCIDGHLDWNTHGSGHYDSRVVRDCEPGTYHFTDPNGDYWYTELLASWNTRNISHMQRGAGYKIDDDTLDIIGSPEYVWGSDIYGGGNVPATTAEVDLWSKLWTHYQNGNEVKKDATPDNCAWPPTDARCD